MNSDDFSLWTETWAFIIGLIGLFLLLGLAVLAAYAAARMGMPISFG